MYNKDDARFINTRTWVLLNHEREGVLHRKNFIESFGGSFVRTRQGFVWSEKSEEEEPKKVKSVMVVIDPDGNEITPKNFQGFCRENNLNKTAMYGVANGIRNHHKNYKCYRKEV